MKPQDQPITPPEYSIRLKNKEADMSRPQNSINGVTANNNQCKYN